MQPVFAMACDANYLPQLETLLKSIYLNVPNATCYVLNGDLPAQWFKRVRRRLVPFGGQIFDCKIDAQRFAAYPTVFEISPITYARFLVPEVVPAARVLYLDVDTLVTADVSPLFELDLKANVIGAACNMEAATGKQPDRFNSGVLLIDCEAWRKQAITPALFARLETAPEKVTFADQQVLNEYFAGQFYRLDKTYNFMLMDQWQVSYTTPGYAAVALEPLPAIMHYIGWRKPWRYRAMGRTHRLWWDYRFLEWHQIADKWQLFPTSHLHASRDPRPVILTLTNSYAIEDLEELLQRLPQYLFVVAAYTETAPELGRLRSYDNLELVEMITPEPLAEWLARATLYLDINYGEKDQAFRQQVVAQVLPILGYADQDNVPEAQVIPTRDVDAMVAAIKRVVNQPEQGAE